MLDISSSTLPYSAIPPVCALTAQDQHLGEREAAPESPASSRRLHGQFAGSRFWPQADSGSNSAAGAQSSRITLGDVVLLVRSLHCLSAMVQLVTQGSAGLLASQKVCLAPGRPSNP
eukprot:1138650-Pelagomonas_calceolata.AAC.3